MERGCQKGFFDVWKIVQKDIVLDAFLLIPFGIVLSRFFFSKKALMNFPSLGNMTYWKFRFTTTAARLDHYEIEKRSWGERERRGETKGTVGETPKTKQKTTSLVMCLNGPSDCWITILAAESAESLCIYDTCIGIVWPGFVTARRPVERRKSFNKREADEMKIIANSQVRVPMQKRKKWKYQAIFFFFFSNWISLITR
jgi:hypothetical protein